MIYRTSRASRWSGLTSRAPPVRIIFYYRWVHGVQLMCMLDATRISRLNATRLHPEQSEPSGTVRRGIRDPYRKF